MENDTRGKMSFRSYIYILEEQVVKKVRKG